MKKHLGTILLCLFFLAGISLLLYPTVSNWWNSRTQSKAIADYDHVVETMDQETYDKILNAAKEYNTELKKHNSSIHNLTEAEQKEYNSILDISGTGIMGTITIPSIDVELPIYHGTSDSVLAIAIGHIPGSSFPIGGSGTHCVLSGHRGLPSARLFTDIDKLTEGDTFELRVLDELATYEVDQIRIVLPHEISELEITLGKDQCTLVTCTPYGINTHRLLVRGHRIQNADLSTVRITSDAVQIDTMVIAPIVAAPILIVLILLVFLSARRTKVKNKMFSEMKEDMKKSKKLTKRLTKKQKAIANDLEKKE